MCRSLLFCLLALAAAPAAAAISTGPVVTINYPDEGTPMPFLKETFILGIATPTPGALTVNGTPVTQYENGAFIAYVPVSPGSFTFHAEYRLADGRTAKLDRSIQIAQPLLPSPPGMDAIDPQYTLPARDVELQPGDWLEVQVKGPPGRRARFEVPGACGWTPLLENADTPGLYQAALPITAAMAAQGARVRFKIDDGFWSSLRAESPGRVTAPATPRVVETVSDQPPIRTAPGEGYMLLPLKGTRFIADGLEDGFARLRLSSDHEGWIATDLVRYLPEGTAPPQAVLGTLHTAAFARETVIAMDLSEQAPYSVEEVDGGLNLRLFNTAAHVNTIVFDSSDIFVTSLRARQESARTAVVNVRLNPKIPLWGWHVAYQDGEMTLTLRQPPLLKPYGRKPLKGVTIVLDPGHSPDVHGDGAIGPAGTTEATANLAIAERLKTLLQGDGADVVMTREGHQDIGLPARVELAWEAHGDLYLSIHNNALPDGADPFLPGRGYMVFYYYPHSRAFAAAVHDAFRAASPRPNEGLRYGNLFVTRGSGMPAILTESDYLIYPDREAALNTPEYQDKLARIHRAGILAFLRGMVPPPEASAPPARRRLHAVPLARRASPATRRQRLAQKNAGRD